MSNFFVSTDSTTPPLRGRVAHHTAGYLLVAAVLTLVLLVAGFTGGVGSYATAAPVTDSSSRGKGAPPVLQGDLPTPVQEKLAELFFKVQEIIRPTPTTIPSSEVKIGVSLFLYHPDVGLYTAKECKVDGLTPSTITINTGCPFDPQRRTAMIAQLYRTAGQITKMAFYKVGTVESAVYGKTTIRRQQGDLPLVAQTPPDPAPARVTFQR